MKKLKNKWSMTILVLFCFGAGAYVVYATEQGVNKQVTVGQNQIVEDDLILAGSNVKVEGEAKEDVIAAGSEVIISGAVKGYALLAGKNITVSGPIGNDLFAAGANLQINAPVADNAVLAGGEIHLQPGAVIHHDAVLAGGKVEVAGKIERDLKLAAGEVQLASEVGGSVQARTDKLTILPTAVIRGNLKVYSPVPPEIAPQAQVLGRIEHIQIERENVAVSWFKRWGYSFLALALVGLAAISLSSLWANRVVTTFTNQPGATFLSGLAGLILIPLIVVLLLASIIGIPLAFMVLALYAVALLLSGVFAAWFVGGWLLSQFNRPQPTRWVRIIVGALVVSLLVSLPWIGGLFGLCILLAGLGALLLERRASWRQLPAEGFA